MKALNLPNQITLARLILSVVFFALLSQYSQRRADEQAWLLDASALLYLIAAGTDFFDGYLARKYGLVTALGRVMDPLVDKVLVCGTFILFAGAGFADELGRSVTGVQSWMVIAIVGREMLVTGLRGYNETVGVNFGASIFGKLKMWTQSITAIVVLIVTARAGRSISNATALTVNSIVVWLTVTVTIASAMQYVYQSRHILEDVSDQDDHGSAPKQGVST